MYARSVTTKEVATGLFMRMGLNALILTAKYTESDGQQHLCF